MVVSLQEPFLLTTNVHPQGGADSILEDPANADTKVFCLVENRARKVDLYVTDLRNRIDRVFENIFSGQGNFSNPRLIRKGVIGFAASAIRHRPDGDSDVVFREYSWEAVARGVQGSLWRHPGRKQTSYEGTHLPNNNTAYVTGDDSEFFETFLVNTSGVVEKVYTQFIGFSSTYRVVSSFISPNSDGGHSSCISYFKQTLIEPTESHIYCLDLDPTLLRRGHGAVLGLPRSAPAPIAGFIEADGRKTLLYQYPNGELHWIRFGALSTHLRATDLTSNGTLATELSPWNGFSDVLAVTPGPNATFTSYYIQGGGLQRLLASGESQMIGANATNVLAHGYFPNFEEIVTWVGPQGVFVQTRVNGLPATVSPTTSPSLSPTPLPTASPTNAPSLPPTASLTQLPTPSPTRSTSSLPKVEVPAKEGMKKAATQGDPQLVAAIVATVAVAVFVSIGAIAALAYWRRRKVRVSTREEEKQHDLAPANAGSWEHQLAVGGQYGLAPVREKGPTSQYAPAPASDEPVRSYFGLPSSISARQ